MKKLLLLICTTLLFSACQEPDQIEIPEPEHFVLDEVLDHIPFDQFNNFSNAIFRDTAGEEVTFSLSVKENVVDKNFEDIAYTTNEISFSYTIEFNFEIPNFSILATSDFLPDLGNIELIYCNSHIVNATAGVPKLTIIPNTDYKNTILNDEFSWLEKQFSTVYSNILIQENNFDKVKIFYQPSMGIIGFVDNVNNSWVLDRFE